MHSVTKHQGRVEGGQLLCRGAVAAKDACKYTSKYVYIIYKYIDCLHILAGETGVILNQ